jgi:zinc transport system substrate-binding protein
MRRILIAAPLTGAVLAALAVSGLSGCSSAAPAKNSAGQLSVVASFYPLQFAAEQIGAGHVAVTSLTKPGAEPHDIELTPKDVATVSRASIVIYEKGLQGAVDKAVETQGGNRGLDVAPAAKLDLLFQPTVGAPAVKAAENTPGAVDPHFWLDPQRYSDVAKVIAGRLSSADPAHKAEYAKNSRAFQARLSTLSRDFSSGLAHCQRKDLVTSHAAFGYLAQRFGMRQVAINGLSPDQEPNASEIAAVSTYARSHGVTTVYGETLASPAIAATVADEAGAKTAVLDPIEGLTDKSAGKDYFEVMGANLKALRTGQGCS